MKILITGTSYFPEFSAGTEVYMELVARSLRERGDAITIACGGKSDAHVAGEAKWGHTEYTHEGIPVIRVVRHPERAELADLYTRQDAARYALWQDILNRIKPGLVFTIGSGAALMGDVEVAAHAFKIPVVCTFIQPRQLCPKGPRINAAGQGCMAPLDARLCGQCLLRSRGGLPGLYPLARILGILGLPAPFLPGRLGTALRLPQLVQGFIQRWDEIRKAVSLFVAHSQAAVALLQANGVTAQRILFSPPGFSLLAPPQPRRKERSSGVRFGFIGRPCAEKGVKTLLAAWQRLGPGLPAELHLWGNPDQGEPDVVDGVRTLVARDPRVAFHGTFAREEISSIYGSIDVLLVPSEWFDNCPFVISEAFAAGVPVIGSDFGGISTMVRHGVDGVLFRMGDKVALGDILRKLTTHPEEVDGLARNVRPPRDVQEHLADLCRAFHHLVPPVARG